MTVVVREKRVVILLQDKKTTIINVVKRKTGFKIEIDREGYKEKKVIQED